MPKNSTIELDLTIDQAIQFVVSCGVVVPFSQLCDDASPEQQEAAVRGTVAAMIEAKQEEGPSGDQSTEVSED